MTDTVRVPREPTQAMLMAGWSVSDHDIGDDEMSRIWSAMLAASPQGEGDCVCVQRGDGPEGCGLCNETGVVTEGVKP